MRRITTTSLAIAVAAILFSVLSVFGQSSLPPMEAQAVYRAPVVVEVEVKLPNGETSVVSTTLVLQITSKTVISGDVLLTDSLSVDVTAAEGVAAEVGPIVRLFSDLVTSEVAAASAPLPAGAEGTVNRNANVRGGPGDQLSGGRPSLHRNRCHSSRDQRYAGLVSTRGRYVDCRIPRRRRDRRSALSRRARGRHAGSNGNTDPKTDGHTASNFYSYREARAFASIQFWWSWLVPVRLG